MIPQDAELIYHKVQSQSKLRRWYNSSGQELSHDEVILTVIEHSADLESLKADGYYYEDIEGSIVEYETSAYYTSDSDCVFVVTEWSEEFGGNREEAIVAAEELLEIAEKLKEKRILLQDEDNI